MLPNQCLFLEIKVSSAENSYHVFLEQIKVKLFIRIVHTFLKFHLSNFKVMKKILILMFLLGLNLISFAQQTVSIVAGPSTMARNATVTYTASISIPTTLVWEATGMDLISASGANATFKAVQDGTAYVRLRSFNGIEAEKEIHIGTPRPEITGEHRVPNGQYATFRASCRPLANATNYQWILNPVNGNTVYGANSQVLDVAFYNAGSYQVIVRASNSYGTGEYTSFGLNVINERGYSITAYPSPASQTLYIDFAIAKEQLNQALKATSKSTNTYNVHLFNIQGSMVRTAQSAGEEISMDVSGLPNGNYILHIYDGIEKKPITQKIVIKH